MTKYFDDLDYVVETFVVDYVDMLDQQGLEEQHLKEFTNAVLE